MDVANVSSFGRYLVLLLIFPTGFTRVRSLPCSKQEILKVIIDNDAGADDATGILLALSSPCVEVVAITCVAGNTQLSNVILNVYKTLNTVERLDVPVYAGSNESLKFTPDTDAYFGEDGFGDFEYPNPPDPNKYLQKEYAPDAIVRLAEKYPGELTLLCLAPLTNIALAIRKSPSLLSKFKNVYVLGGAVEGVGNVKPGIEYNFYFDPEAAYIVFKFAETFKPAENNIVLIPWETVSTRNLVKMDWRQNILGKLDSPKINLLNNAERLVLRPEFEYWFSGDPVATAVALQNCIVKTSSKYHLSVESAGEFARGAVFVDYLGVNRKAPNAEIIKYFDVNKYKEFLISRLQ